MRNAGFEVQKLWKNETAIHLKWLIVDKIVQNRCTGVEA
jgi:hypothetical protein